MHQFNPTQAQLIAILADGHCHSGTALGEFLGMSRTAVWKQIKQLTKMGIPIESLPQQGYRLPSDFKLLDAALINNRLTQLAFNAPINLHIVTSIDSTNNYLKILEKSDQIDVCTAETQTHGRGRLGRQWVSPFGENIYLSSRWNLNCCLSKLSGLSLIVSLAVHDCLLKNGIDDIWVKWPNDLIWNHKKLCGILIEIIAETNSSVQVIIGIGLNVKNSSIVDNPWCSLQEITGQYTDRNVLIADLLYALKHYLDKFTESNFSAFKEQWQKIDYLAGYTISLSQPTGSLRGYAQGVNANGHLCLIDEKGNRHELSSGDTSLLRIEG